MEAVFQSVAPPGRKSTGNVPSQFFDRLVGQHIVVRLKGGVYLLVTVAEFSPGLFGCIPRWGGAVTKSYKNWTEITPTGISVAINAFQSIEFIIVGKKRKGGLRIQVRAPMGIDVDRWEILVKKGPEFSQKLQRQWPGLFSV